MSSSTGQDSSHGGFEEALEFLTLKNKGISFPTNVGIRSHIQQKRISEEHNALYLVT